MPTNSFSFKSLASNSKIRFLIGFLIVFIFQIWSAYKGVGAAKTHDSLQYLKTAENLVLQHDFIRTESQPYVEWALGFPFLLILFRDSIFLNLLCILGIYIFYFELVEKLFQKTITKWWLILAFILATPLYLIHHFVWSEPPFLLFLIGIVWAFYYLIKNNDEIDSKKLFWFCLFGFLFTSMRNAGLYFVIGINSGIILFYITPSLLKDRQDSSCPILWRNLYFKPLVYFSFSSILPIFLWWLHAKTKTKGSFDTIYNLALRTVSEECINYGDILSRWLFPPSVPLKIRIFLLLFFIVFMSLAVTQITVRLFKDKKWRIDKNIKFILFIFWITLVYLIGMLLSRAGMKIDAERFLAIIYPFLCLLVGFVLDKMKVNDYLKYGIAFLGLIYPFLRTLKNIIFWN
jgi:hypothetical protein